MSVGRVLYSVPWAHIGSQVDARVSDRLVEVFVDGSWSRPSRGPSGAGAPTTRDYPPEKIAFFMRTPVWCRRRAEATGPHVSRAGRRAAGEQALHHLRAAQGILGLADRYGADVSTPPAPGDRRRRPDLPDRQRHPRRRRRHRTPPPQPAAAVGIDGDAGASARPRPAARPSRQRRSTESTGGGSVRPEPQLEALLRTLKLPGDGRHARRPARPSPRRQARARRIARPALRRRDRPPRHRRTHPPAGRRPVRNHRSDRGLRLRLQPRHPRRDDPRPRHACGSSTRASR